MNNGLKDNENLSPNSNVESVQTKAGVEMVDYNITADFDRIYNFCCFFFKNSYRNCKSDRKRFDMAKITSPNVQVQN